MISNIDEAKELIIDAVEAKELKTMIAKDEPHETISELADSNCDIYTSDLLKWLSEDSEAISHIEDALSELGTPEADGKPDFIKMIMQGQYQANTALLWEAWEKIKEDQE